MHNAHTILTYTAQFGMKYRNKTIVVGKETHSKINIDCYRSSYPKKNNTILIMYLILKVEGLFHKISYEDFT